MEKASIFLLFIIPLFEPAGEECGTKYDEAFACAQCSSGAKQVTDLFLDCRRIPKKKDAAVTFAGEIVVSRVLWICLWNTVLKEPTFFP